MSLRFFIRAVCTTLDKKKKEPFPRFAVRRTLFDHLISCSMTHDQRRAKVADDLDRSLSSTITRSNSVLLTTNLGDGSFFLSRAVVVFVCGQL